MPSYSAPIRDINFLLNEVLEIERYANLPGFADATGDTLTAIIEAAATLAQDVLQPINLSGDEEGCTRHADGSVTAPKGFKEAYQQFVAGGWPALSCATEFGGQGLPATLSLAVSEMIASANVAFGMYPGLSHGVYSALLHHGGKELQDIYLPKIVSGEWTGTMNLTEPHCGTDLGMLRTKASPQADGSYKISGQKIFISAGEHDMADNIIHLVLARIDGAPAGTKGISLFVAPKFLVNADGSLGARNPITCGKLEEKMGIHGNATCVLNYDEATGWLVGEPGRGLNAMFTMMNEARIAVALQGLALSEVAYQNAAAYAKDRLQGRSLTGPKNPDGPADPIIVHPDVRRLLLDAKSFNEGARAFLYWTSLQGDLQEKSPDEAARTKASDMMALLTPVLKGYLTDKGFENTVNAQQVYGGHGFIEEQGMSQFVRDARIAMIYEGANGVQAMDLVGRKLAQNGGRSVMTFFKELDDFIKAHEGDADLKPFTDGLKASKERLQKATMWFMQNAMANPDNAGAAATDYLHLFGITGTAFGWALIAKAAAPKKDSGDPFYATKLKTGTYFMQRVVPNGAAHLAKIESGAASLMALSADEF
ncbi:MAG: acyl-CoA dehydrogenase C-terminal domain-containing protein [Caulobacterales bacterium]